MPRQTIMFDMKNKKKIVKKLIDLIFSFRKEKVKQISLEIGI